MNFGYLYSILIADDESIIRNSLSSIIPWEDYGFQVIGTASNGLDALEFIKKYRPHLVLTDIRMPDFDGIELIREIHYTYPETKSIIISGYDDFGYAKSAIKYGSSSYLLKPVEKKELLDELISVKKELDDLFSQKDAAAQQFKQRRMSQRALREQFLNHLIHNEYKHVDEIMKQLTNTELSLHNSTLRVFVFTYHLPDEYKEGVFSKKDNLLFKASVYNIMEELLTNNTYAFFDYDNYIILLLNMPIAIHDATVSPKCFCQNILETFKCYLGISMQAGIGDEVMSLLEAPRSYKTAMEHLSYRLFDGSETIFDSSVLCSQSPPGSATAQIDNQEIVKAICSGKKEQVFSLTDLFFDSLFYTEKPSPAYVKGMCIHFIIDIQKRLDESYENQPIFQEQSCEHIYHLTSLQEIKEWILMTFDSFMDTIGQDFTSLDDPVIQAAKLYIQENLLSKLRVEDVAAHVNLSENYFTVYFKEKTHINFKNYVLKLKMDYAMTLLKTTDMTINEISCLLGYEDYRSFYRIFKKMKGKTPSEISRIYRL